MTDRRHVYECAVHGLVEAASIESTFELGEDGEPGTAPYCPVSLGYEGGCGLLLDGPFEVRRVD